MEYKIVLSSDSDTIIHYGVKRKSGRYPYGSGERPYQSEPRKATDSELRKVNRKYSYQQLIDKERKNFQYIKDNADDYSRMTGISAKRIKKYVDKYSDKILKRYEKQAKQNEQIVDDAVDKLMQDGIKLIQKEGMIQAYSGNTTYTFYGKYFDNED